MSPSHHTVTIPVLHDPAQRARPADCDEDLKDAEAQASFLSLRCRSPASSDHLERPFFFPLILNFPAHSSGRLAGWQRQLLARWADRGWHSQLKLPPPPHHHQQHHQSPPLRAFLAAYIQLHLPHLHVPLTLANHPVPDVPCKDLRTFSTHMVTLACKGSLIPLVPDSAEPKPSTLRFSGPCRPAKKIRTPPRFGASTRPSVLVLFRAITWQIASLLGFIG